MGFQALEIEGVWLKGIEVHEDRRGSFHSTYISSEIARDCGRAFSVKQVNESKSSAGVIRGFHWVDSQLGQAKLVTCTRGSIWDVVVDTRVGSKTFGSWLGVFLDSKRPSSLLISEGIAHGFLALEPDSVISYLCTSEYEPEFERSFSPIGGRLNIPFSDVASQHGIDALVLSDRDLSSPNFDEVFKLDTSSQATTTF